MGGHDARLQDFIGGNGFPIFRGVGGARLSVMLVVDVRFQGRRRTPLLGCRAGRDATRGGPLVTRPRWCQVGFRGSYFRHAVVGLVRRPRTGR